MCLPGISVFDYSNPTTFYGDPTGFRDAMHYRGGNAALMLEALGRGQGDLCH
jgi:hypothetical protein